MEEIPCSVARTKLTDCRRATQCVGRQRQYTDVLFNIMWALKFIKLEAVTPPNPWSAQSKHRNQWCYAQITLHAPEQPGAVLLQQILGLFSLVIVFFRSWYKSSSSKTAIAESNWTMEKRSYGLIFQGWLSPLILPEKSLLLITPNPTPASSQQAEWKKAGRSRPLLSEELIQ